MNEAASALILAALEGKDVSPGEAAFFSRYPVSGMTLFKRNVGDSLGELGDLCKSLQEFRHPKAPSLMIAIDQEGGRVSRLPAPFPNLGPALNLDSAVIESYGADVGRELLKLNINVNFAPVADVLSNEANTAIGDRVFAREPDLVVERAGAFLRGLEEAGVLGCLKHFPGQGDAPADTHLSSALVDIDRDLLDRRELIPFKKMHDLVSMVMVSHCIYPALDQVPASLSKKIITGLLREEIGFRGVVVSDDFLMEALPQDDASWKDALCEAVAAGTDLLLICRYVDRAAMAVDALSNRAAASPAFTALVETAAGRVFKLRSQLSC